jgi:hypothetical protein
MVSGETREKPGQMESDPNANPLVRTSALSFGALLSILFSPG